MRRRKVNPGPEVIKLFSCSTQLSMKFFLLRNVNMPTIVGILTVMSRKNSILDFFEPKKSRISWYFYTYEHLKFPAQLSWVWKKFYYLWACCVSYWLWCCWGKIGVCILGDGWMTLHFTFFSTVFLLHKDDRRVIMKGSVQWSNIYVWTQSAGLEPTLVYDWLPKPPGHADPSICLRLWGSKGDNGISII